MLKAVRLRNFRSLEDTGEVELRPLVLLVGANSSGKSSFLRFFPLLRQTARTNASSPLLWFGDDVDYGDFGRVVGGDEDPAIEVSLRMMNTTPGVLRTGEVELNCRIIGNREHSRVERCSLQVFGHRVQMEFAIQGELQAIRVDDRDMPLDASGPDVAHAKPEQRGLVPLPHHELPRLQQVAYQRLVNAMVSASEGKFTKARLDAVVGFPHAADDEFLRRMMSETELRVLTTNDELVADMGRLLIVRDLRLILEGIAGSLEQYARQIGYVGPFRSAPERYYRKQDLATDRIARDGENLAMVLRSLSPRERGDLSAWVHQYFGFGLHVEQEGDHVALKVEVNGGRRFDLVDMGFGLSQVLPIVVQCWLAGRTDGRRGKGLAVASLLAIEQPELHLHPVHQANLADMLAAVVRAEREVGRWSPMIVETHSNALVNRLGELVSEGVVLPSEVSVLLFEKGEDGVTRVREAAFNAEGVLENWPVGFLSA